MDIISLNIFQCNCITSLDPYHGTMACHNSEKNLEGYLLNILLLQEKHFKKGKIDWKLI